MIKLCMIFWDEVRYELTTGSPLQRVLNFVLGIFVLAVAASMVYQSIELWRSLL